MWNFFSGAKVYLACRSLDRAQHAAQDIQKETGAIADKLPIIRLDLGSLKSVREFVTEFRKSMLTYILYSFKCIQDDLFCLN